MSKRPEKLKERALDTVRNIDDKLKRQYPQPAPRLVVNNRVVFGVGMLTGIVIGLWLGMFFSMYLPRLLEAFA